MLDIHPPHHAANTWRDFLIHIATIVIGLLIAIGLEQTVEYAHRRHILHQAETDLRAETRDNRELLAKDEAQLQAARRQFSANLQTLIALRAHSDTPNSLSFNWHWSDMQSSAWATARDTGALALMPYEDAQGFSMIYGQQDIVNRQSGVYIADIYRTGSSLEDGSRTGSPLESGKKLSGLRPAQIDALVANTQQTLADIAHLRDLCRSLDSIYEQAAK